LLSLFVLGSYAASCARTPACVNTAAKGYWNNHSFYKGLPAPSNGNTYLFVPSGVDYCELAELNSYCVQRVNMYRTGALIFSDNSTDPGIPRDPLQYAVESASCSAAQAFGDMSGSTGGCDNAHANVFSCPGDHLGHNTCCFRNGSTYSEIQNELDKCLQQMWDEGIGLPSDSPFSSTDGRWYNIRNSAYTHASCGFAFSEGNGGLWMSIDFFSGGDANLTECNCSLAGASDGCGGICVNSQGSTCQKGTYSAGTAAKIAGAAVLGIVWIWLGA